MVLVSPTFVPPLEQSGLPLVSGPQTKNSTLPLTSPSLPLKVATSTTDSPLLIDVTSLPSCWTWVSILGASQVANSPSRKFFSSAVSDVEERVSARNDEKHGAPFANSASRL